MNLSPALEQLSRELAAADQHQLSADPSKVHVWAELVRELEGQARGEWLPERGFRLRTGASPKWCRRHRAAFLTRGLVRGGAGHWEWHISCRPPRPAPADTAGRVRAIVDSFQPQQVA